MEKDIITGVDIEMLIRESKKLKPGEIVRGSITKTIVGQGTGYSKVITGFQKDSPDTDTVIDFTGTTKNESTKEDFPITGQVHLEAIRSGIQSKSSHPFHLKRDFFEILNKLEKSMNMQVLNLGKIIYHNDEQGRVYFEDENGLMYYMNSSLTGFIREDEVCGALTCVKGKYEIQFDSDYHFDPANFDYYYITRKDEKAAEELEKQEERETLARFGDVFDYFREEEVEEAKPQFGKVVDLEEYRRFMEDRGPHR